MKLELRGIDTADAFRNGPEAKELIKIAGANGVGKTTVAEEYVRRQGYRYYNADAYAADVARMESARVRLTAARRFLTDFREALRGDDSVVVESTVAGLTLRNTLQAAGRAGFRIVLIYLFVDSVDVCLERIRLRARKGGHFVSEEDVRRRFFRSLRNFWQVYRPLVDHWLLVYNGSEESQEVAMASGDSIFICDSDLFDQFLSLLGAERQ